MPAPAPIATDTLPPHSVEAEECLLGAVLAHPEVAPDVVRAVTPGDFYGSARASLWSVVVGITDAGSLPDPIVVLAECERLATHDRAEVAELVRAFMAQPFHSVNAEHYAGIVREKSRLRRLRALGLRILAGAADGLATDDVLDEARTGLADVEDDLVEAQMSVADILDDAMAEIEASTVEHVVTTGYPALDDLVGPFEPGRLYLLGGRPSMGKTALGINLATNVASQGHHALFVTIEMSRNQVVRRILSTFSGIHFRRFRRGTLLIEEEFAALAAAKQALKRLPLRILDVASPSIEDLRAEVRRAVTRHGARLVVIDYLQIMRAPSSRTIKNRENEIAMISRGLKAMAKQYQVPVLVLSQLSREAARGNRDVKSAADVSRPTLTDLRDSGSLEQDADQVWFVHRPAYYTKARHGPEALDAEVIVAKARDAETGTVHLDWRGEVQRFESRGSP